MKVLLINPPSPFLLDDKVFPPLGLLQVASELEATGHQVKVADFGGISNIQAAVEQEVLEEDWDVYGLTATTPQFPTAVDIMHRLRGVDPSKRVILGGPHATVMPESCGQFDTIVLGDGEDAIAQAIQPDSPKIIDYASTTQKGELNWRWPARHLIDMQAYQYRLGGRLGTSMMLSQGCPYQCSFCCGRLVPYYRRVRSRNVDDVVKEMEHLVTAYGVGAVMAFDDEINLLNEPLIEFCDKIAPLGLKFRAFVKANLFNDIQAEAMARAGFTDVCTGVESGDDRVLGIIDKQTTREVNKRFVDLCRKYGMRSKAFCSLGHPGENQESAENLKSWLLYAKPDDFDVTVITIYPGTPIWAGREVVGEEDGKRVCKFTKKSRNIRENGATIFFEELDYSKDFAFYKGRPKEYVSHVWTPDLSKLELVSLRDEIEEVVRRELAIPYPKRYSGDFLDGQDNFEHSMGAGVTPQDSRVALKGGTNVSNG